MQNLVWLDFSNNITLSQQYLLADAQTSGGLLISVPEDKFEILYSKLEDSDCNPMCYYLETGMSSPAFFRLQGKPCHSVVQVLVISI